MPDTRPGMTLQLADFACAVTWRPAMLLCRLFLQIGLPFAERGKPVHLCAMRKRTLGRNDIFRLALPCRLRRVLERAPIGEGKGPWQIADLVHGVEMSRSFFVTLPA